MNVVFLKQTQEGKLKRISNLEDADYVRIPAALYRESTVNKDRGDIVHIHREEYNGFLKMLRILRDRELQQIEKEKADSHGYTTKYVDERIYDRSKPDITAFCVIKTTPISLRIDLQTAYTLIKKDLQEFYAFIDIEGQDFISNDGIHKKIRTIDLLEAFKKKRESNSEYGRKLKEIVDNSPEAVSFGPIKLSANWGQGVYEVTYWAAEPV